MVVLGTIVAFGLRPSAWTWSAFTWLKLAPLAALLALFAFAPVAPTSDTLKVTDSAGAVPGGAPGVATYGRALLVALFPLQGFEVIPVLAGSARKDSHALALATVGSLGFAALLYFALQLACVAALPALAAESAPLVAAAGVLGGPAVSRAVALGTNVSALGIAFGMLVMTPRYLAVLGTERDLGRWLGRFDERGVPRPALVLTIACVTILLLFERAVEALIVLASAAVLIQYLTALVAVLRLGMARRHGLTRAAAIPAVLGFGAVVLLGHSIQPHEAAVLAAALLAGAALWFVRGLLRARGARPA
jgi:amino acid transporter